MDELTVEAVTRLVMWLHWTPPMKKFEIIFGKGRHPSYVAEKLPLVSGDLSLLWGVIDPNAQQRLVDAANRKYEEDQNARKGNG